MAEYSTAREIITQVRREVRDTDRLKYDNAQLISYINRTQRQLAKLIALYWPYYHIRTSRMSESNFDLLLSLVNSDYQWTASGSGTDEYYLEDDGGGDPSIDEPEDVYEDGDEMDDGIMGSLGSGEWGWGDNDSLGYDTVYVRLSDGSDPDSKEDGYVRKNRNMYPLPDDFFREVVVTVNGTFQPCLDYTDEYLQYAQNGYVLENDKLVLSPTPDDTGTLSIKYVPHPTVVNVESDTVDYASEFPDFIIEGVCVFARANNQDNSQHNLQVLSEFKKMMQAHVVSTNQARSASLGLDVSNDWI